MKKLNRLFSILLIIMICLSFTACKKPIASKELTENYNFSAIGKTENFSEQFNILSYKTFKDVYLSAQTNNILYSPLSTYLALCLSMNGTDGQTLKEYEDTFGGTKQEVNNFASKMIEGYIESQSVKTANSVWFDKTITIKENYLKAVKEYFNANAYESDFSDTKTVNDINNWCYNNTNGMIEKIIEQIPKDTLVYLINSLYFESKWETAYDGEDVNNLDFTSINKQSKKVSMMRSTESTFFYTENARGFMKPYKDTRFSFMAILPDSEENFDGFISELDGKDIFNSINNKQSKCVHTLIPEFEMENTHNLSDIFNKYIPTSFTSSADFTPMTNTPICIDQIIQKTKIEVNKNGTKAAAITIIGNKATSAGPQETINIYLNRPFVYGIFDNQLNIPLFLGCVKAL